MPERTYHIRTVHDFLKVPADRRDVCIQEFSVWCGLVENSLKLFGNGAQAPDNYHWIDDGKHHAAVLIQTPDNQRTEIISGRMKGFPDA